MVLSGIDVTGSFILTVPKDRLVDLPWGYLRGMATTPSVPLIDYSTVL